MMEVQQESLLGKTVLVGLTYTGHDGAFISQEQFFGKIVTYRSGEGIELRLAGKRDGESFRLPPDLTQLHPAAPGEYTLRDTGEVIIDPDFTTTWILVRSEPKL